MLGSKRIAIWTVALAGAGATVGLSAFAAFELARGTRAPRVEERGVATESKETAADSGARAAGSARPDLRVLIREAVRNAPVKTAADLDAYLATLEEQARRRGRVTALDVEPGLELCLIQGEPDKAKRFSDRMLDLQRELAGTKAEPPSRR